MVKGSLIGCWLVEVEIWLVIGKGWLVMGTQNR